MASHSPAPTPDTKPDDTKADSGQASGGGTFMGFPVAKWAIAAISVIAVCYVGGDAFLKLRGELEDQKTQLAQKTAEVKQATDKVTALTAVNQDTSTYTNAVNAEKKFHEKDQSGHRILVHHDQRGDIVATYFDSDGCIAIARPGSAPTYSPYAKGIVDWSLGPDKKPASSPPTTPLASRRVRRETPHVELASMTLAPHKPQAQPVQAGCMNPHPWAFKSSWGPANGCWAPQYRQWNDGCQHYQMYNACTGAWDPQIHWIKCVPNHHP